jgi:hypothetical protein
MIFIDRLAAKFPFLGDRTKYGSDEGGLYNTVYNAVEQEITEKTEP